MITKEQYERLSHYQSQLYTSLHAGYCRNLGIPAVTELDEIYVEIFKEQSKLKGGCPACVLSEMKRLAVEYEKYVPAKSEAQSEEPIEDKPKRKQGKKK